MSQALLEGIDGGIATLTMNRPEARNALSAEMVLTDNRGIAACLEALRNGVPAMANRALPGPVDFARLVRIKPGEQHADLRRGHEAMAERPAFSL